MDNEGEKKTKWNEKKFKKVQIYGWCCGSKGPRAVAEIVEGSEEKVEGVHLAIGPSMHASTRAIRTYPAHQYCLHTSAL